jgi:integrase
LNRITLDRSPMVARCARAQISALFVWALKQGLTETNPVVGTAQPKGGQPRERVLSDNELARIWQACGDDEHGRCIKLLILTGCRRAEIGGMCWREFDNPENPGTWTLPAARAKNHHALALPWLPMMQAVIGAVPRMASRDQLFGQTTSGFTAWADGKRALDARLGFAVPWVVHDVRRSVATGMADLGVNPWIIEQILNHRSGHKGGIGGVYNKSSYEREVRNALALWHDHVRSLVEGSARKVIALPKTAS